VERARQLLPLLAARGNPPLLAQLAEASPHRFPPQVRSPAAISHILYEKFII
jgi:hypothetical protein